jgi:predicted dehydrogenase
MRNSLKDKINIGVVGYGYWGPNIVRNLQGIRGAQVVTICDKRRSIFKKIYELYPSIRLCDDYHDVTSAADIDAVAIITPVFTHFKIAIDALKHGKHVFVEKPFTASVRDAEELVKIADKKKLRIMVDHTYLFTGAVKKIKQMVDSNVLGSLFYYDSTRVNLGLLQYDVNVIWDLALHDLSVMDYIVKYRPVAISAIGIDHFARNKENIAYITVYFANNMIGHLNVNWLSPVKIRLTLIGGSKKMLVWNDLEPDEKIKIYDKGVKIRKTTSIYKLLVDYRSGNMWAPKIDHTEALKSELDYFIKYLNGNFKAINDGYAGLRMVRMLEATSKSVRQGGKIIKL